jgi:hypothetical protein
MTPAERDSLWYDVIAAVATVAFLWTLIFLLA